MKAKTGLYQTNANIKKSYDKKYNKPLPAAKQNFYVPKKDKKTIG